MRLYRLKFDGISVRKKQINVPVESSFKLGIEIAGCEDLESELYATLKTQHLSRQDFGK